MNFIIARRQLLESNKQKGKAAKQERTAKLLQNLHSTNVMKKVIDEFKRNSPRKSPKIATPVKEAFKRNDCSAPTLVPRAVVMPSNLRNSPRRIGYSASGEKLYTEQGWEANPFQFSCLQNIGTLFLFALKCVDHGRKCKGALVFQGDSTKKLHKSFGGTCFACFEFECNTCSEKHVLESDFF